MDEMAAILFALGLTVAAVTLAVVLPIASFVGMRRARAAAQALEQRIGALESAVRTLERTWLSDMRTADGSTAAPQPAEVRAEAGRAPAAPGPAPVPGEEPPPPQPPVTALRPEPVPDGGPTPGPAAVAPETVGLSTAHTVVAQEPADAAGIDRQTGHPGPSRPTETIESRIGGRGLLYVGAVALLFGVAFFVKYAFDNDWINETARVGLGSLTGLALVALGWRLDRRGYAQYGQILAGTGFVALYISTFAAISSYGLLSQGAAFGLMVAITLASALMADRLPAYGLAVVAVLGGFATPFLVGGGEDRQVTLLTYDAILAVGTVYLAGRRSWPSLSLFAYALSALTFIAWADRYYDASKYATTQVFLVAFCTIFLAAWWVLRRGSRAGKTAAGWLAGTDGKIEPFLATVPIVFHVASLVNLQSHPLPLLVYLLLFTLAGVVASIRLDRAWLRLVVLLTAAPFVIGWVVEHRSPGWVPAATVAVLAVYVLHLAGQWEGRTRRPDDRPPRADVALFHANGLALAGGVYALTWDWPLPWSVGLALVQAAWHAALAWATRRWRQEVSPNALALMFAMLGLAIGLLWDGWPAIVAWMIEGGAVVWVGLRTRQAWLRACGVTVTAWMLLLALFNDFFLTPAGFTMVWNARVGAGAVLIAVLYFAAAAYRRAETALPEEAPVMRAAYLVAANVMTLLLASTEVNSYWHARAGSDAAADLALQASLSILWVVYGTALIVAGIVRRYRPVRYLAIAILSLTIVKVFLSDLSQLGGIYRIAGFLGLGAFLLVGAWLYQKYKDIIVGDRR